MKTTLLSILLLCSVLLQAQTILSFGEEFQVTSTPAYETTPTLGNDGISDLVVFTVRPDGSSAGDIWYQRIVGGALSGSPVRVTSSDTDDELNDVWGDYIVYTACTSLGSGSGDIMLYKISTATLQLLSSAAIILEPKIHDNYVVWREGGPSSAKIMLYLLDWIGTYLDPVEIAGPVPPTFQVEIGDRFIVWTEYEDGQYDVVVRDLEDATTFPISDTPLVDESNPSTYGPWVVWSAQTHETESTSIIAKNADTWETLVIADDGAYNLNPSISGDLIVWESTINGKLDLFAYRFSTGETYQITTQENDQYLNDIFGNLIVYADNRDGFADIYAKEAKYSIAGIYIPDPNFEQALIDLGIDSDNTINQRILKSDAEGVTTLDVSDPESNVALPNVSGKIADLTGIEAFINLTELNCSYNQLTILNVTQNTGLVKLFCDNNQLTGLDVSNNVYLDLIWCQHNGLTSLDISHNPVLEYLRMHNNLVSSLDLSQNAELYSLACGTNLFTAIDLTANTKIQYLACNNLQLSTLIVSHIPKLRTLLCGDNNLTTLNLSMNTELFELFCENNLLTELDLSNNQKLVGMKCHDNSLAYLNLKNRFNSILTSLDATNNKLSCINVDDELADHSAWLVDPGVIFSNNCGYNTQLGESVMLEMPVSPTKTAIITYEKVVLSGETTIEVKTEEPAVPDGYKTLDPSEIFDIKTTAEYEGKIEVELDYSELTVEKEEALRMLHKEVEIWVDVTKSLDVENKIIKGEVSTLSPFVIVEDIQPPVLSGVPADISLECSSDVPGNPEVTATDNVAGSVMVGYSEVREDGNCINDYVITKTWTASDDFGNTTSQSQVVTVSDNTPPVITIPADVTLECNMSTDPANTGMAIAIDNCDGAVIVSFEDVFTADYGNTSIITRTWTASDACGNTSTDVQSITIDVATPPVLSNLMVPIDPVSVGTSVSISLDFQDNNLIEALIDWGDGYQSFGDIGQNVITGQYTYSFPGVYVLNIHVQDACGEEASVIHQYIVIYDPEGGFVTGGGWIFSPEGAYKPDPLLTGKASFGFVSKYRKGSSVPDGNTEFQFKAGNLNFKSTDYEWLVIAGSKAMFKGSGTINGFGDYGFMLSAIDADLTPSAVIDKFRIKIWDKDNGDVIVYDNNLEVDDNADPTTEIGGGSIIIHTVKTKSTEIESDILRYDEGSSLFVYPNPFSNRLQFEFVSPVDSHARIDLFNSSGRILQTVFNSPVKGLVHYNAEFVPTTQMSGIIYYRMTLGTEVFNGKVVFNK